MFLNTILHLSWLRQQIPAMLPLKSEVDNPDSQKVTNVKVTAMRGPGRTGPPSVYHYQ
jgi:hypothetical protein